MEIGILTTLEPEKGQRRYINILATHMGKLGENVTIIEPQKPFQTQNERKYMNVDIIPFNKLRESGKKFDIINFQLCNSPYHEFQIHFARSLMEITSYVVTTVHDPRNIQMANLKCKECIGYISEKWLYNFPISPFNIVDKAFQRDSQFLIFHSGYMLKRYLHRYQCQTPAEVIPHIAYRTDTDILSRCSNIQGKSTDNPEIKEILVPGYISPHKGDEMIIKAMSNIKGKFKLIFMGRITNNNYYTYLLDLIHKYNLTDKVEFLGHVTDDLFIKEMDKAYIVLNPRLITKWVSDSLMYKLRKIINLDYLIDLPTSGVIVFALCSGKPIVCSKNEGYFEYVGNDRGILCEDNVESWRSAIQYLLDNPSVVNQMSLQAAKFANEELNPQKIARKHLIVYEKVLENGSKI